MFLELLEWLAKQPTPVATFLGTLAGSLLGLVALLLGALFNAHLNRRRDDRLRNEEARSIVVALTGELTGLRDAFLGLAHHLTTQEASYRGPNPDNFLVPDIESGVRVMPVLLPKFGLLPAAAVRQLIDVYVIIEHFRPTLLLIGGKLHSNNDVESGHVQMQGMRSGPVAELARNTANKIDAAIKMLSS